MRGLGPPSGHVQQLVAALRRGGTWWPVGQELLAQEVPIADDRFVPRLAALLDVAFYASMTTEEARRATFSIAIAKPTDFRGHVFDKPKPLDVKLLRKLSAACDDDGAAIFVWFDNAQWFAWAVGLNEKTPLRSAKTRSGNYHLMVTVRDAGAFDVRWQDEVVFTYAEGSGNVLGEQLWAAEAVKAALPTPAPNRIAMHHLVAIQRAMRRHGRGGALLVVESTPTHVEVGYPIKPSEPWTQSYGKQLGELHEGPLAHAAMAEEAFRREIADVASEGKPSSNEELRRYGIDRADAEAALIGNLTAIDGLVIIDHTMCVTGFGVKIPVPEGFGGLPVTHMNALDRAVTETTAGEFFSGMRHKSAASICAAARNAVALVQSQDGALSVMIAKDGALTVINPLAHLVDPAHRWPWKYKSPPLSRM